MANLATRSPAITKVIWLGQQQRQGVFLRTDMSDVMTKQIKVTRVQHGVAGLVFAIDTPRAEEITLFASSILKLSGWVLHNKKSVDIVLRHRHGENTFRCNRVRPDV